MASSPRVLVAATTPGPSQALAGAVSHLREQGTDVVLLSSSDRRFGRGDQTFARFGLACETVEDILPEYRPMHVPEADASAVLDRLTPDALLAGAVNEPDGDLRPLEDALCAAARRKGLPSLQFVEGWDVWQPRHWGPPPADTYLAVDEIAARVLVAHGVAAGNVHEVGYSPTLLSPALRDPERRAQVRARLGVAGTERLIAVFGQVVPDDPTTLGWIARAKYASDRLFFQRHPRDIRSDSELLDKCPGSAVELSTLPTEDMIHAADVCATHFSLVSFATAALGIPTILTLLDDDVPNVRRILGAYPTTLLGGTVECYDYAGLKRVFEDIHPPAQTFIDKVKRSAADFSCNLASLVRAAAAGQSV